MELKRSNLVSDAPVEPFASRLMFISHYRFTKQVDDREHSVRRRNEGGTGLVRRRRGRRPLRLSGKSQRFRADKIAPIRAWWYNVSSEGYTLIFR